MQSEPVENPEIKEETKEQLAPETEAAAIDVADNSVSEDDVLDRLLGIDAPEPRRDVPSPDHDAPPDPDVDRAVKALRRDGVPSDVIESYRSNPDKLKEWGLKAAKRQADVDAFGAKVAESKKIDAEPKATPKASSSTDDRESDADPLSQFGEIFGEEATKPIRDLTKQLRSEFDERARHLEVRYETQSAYEKIARDYGKSAPSLADISEVAARIGRENPGSFASVTEIVQEAFRQRAGEPKRVDPRNVAKPSIGKPPARPVREVDKEDRILDVLLSGGTREDALRVVNR